MKTLVINFKTYEEATGKNALKLAKICEKFSKKYNSLEIIVSPQFTDLPAISKLKLKIFSQHVDPVEPGRNTGHITPFAVKNYASGTFLNHSEKKLSISEIEKCIALCKKYSLETLCFAKDLKECKKIIPLEPNYLAYEPPELVGGKISVSEAKPEILRKFVNLIKEQKPRIKALCGAGINKLEDVEKAVELGTDGICLSSAFVKSNDHVKFLKEIIKPLV